MSEPYSTTPTAPAPVAPSLSVTEAPASGSHRADGGASPAPDSSPLGDLRRLRERRAERNYLDLRVPGWGEEEDLTPRVSIYVRVRAIKPSELASIRERRVPKTGNNSAKAKRNDWVDLINADVIIAACLEVWAQTGDPEDPRDLDESARLSLDAENPYGEKTRFDGRLSDAIGMPRNSDGTPPTAVQICMELFGHEGNVARAANHLIDFSNLGSEREATDFMNT